MPTWTPPPKPPATARANCLGTGGALSPGTAVPASVLGGGACSAPSTGRPLAYSTKGKEGCHEAAQEADDCRVWLAALAALPCPPVSGLTAHRVQDLRERLQQITVLLM